VTLNGQAYLAAGALYETDGTMAGTTQIFYNFTDVQSLINFDGSLYFTCLDTTTGGSDPDVQLALYKSDGTAAGTGMVTELPVSSTASAMVDVNGKLLIEADSGSPGIAYLWTSDGTAGGTNLFYGATLDSPVAQHPNELVSTGSEAYLIGSNGTYADELFETDGTQQPTLVKNIRNGALADESQIAGLTTQDLIAAPTGKVYFSADDGMHGIELWYSGGSAAGTAMVADINKTTDSSSPTDFVNYNGLTYFSANDGSGDALFSTDATAANTQLVGSEGEGAANLTVANGLLYFVTDHGLFETNGNTVSPVAPFNVSAALVSDLTNCGGELYFAAERNQQPGVWVIPTAGAAPVELVTIQATNVGFINPDFASTASKVFFVFADAQDNITLYTTQGTPGSTVAVTTLDDLSGLAPFGNDVYFDGYDPSHGNTLWRSDGTAQGTGMFADVPVALPGNDSDIAVAGNYIYFAAKDSAGAYQLFKSNGSAGSTAPLPGTYFEMSDFTTFGNDIVFSAAPDDTGYYQPWISNGTAAGTLSLSTTLYLGDWSPDFTVDGPLVYFGATTTSGAGGVQLWATNGTVPGTRQAAIINPSGNADPSNFDPQPDGSILFSAYTPALGTELWRYNAPVVTASISGSITAGGSGLGGVTVYLDANGNSVLDPNELRTTTTANGSFAFSNVPVGAYTIRQILPAGYTQSSPANNAGLPISVVSASVLTGEKFVDAPPALKRLTGKTIGTSGSYKNDGNTIGKATDGNLSTYFDGPTANGSWVGLDLGSSQTVRELAFAPRSGYAGRMVGGEIQISTSANFTTGVTTICTISTAPVSGKLTTITLTNPVTARYVRYLSPNGSYGDISEFEVLG
jgi:ELWxxDGT repeat protein